MIPAPRTMIPALPSSGDWTIRDVGVVNVMALPTDADQRRSAARQAEAARRHEPLIMRTLMDGPGNRSQIVRCACGSPDVKDSVTWCIHVGLLGGESLLEPLLALRDAARDSLDYPGDETARRLRRIIDQIQISGTPR